MTPKKIRVVRLAHVEYQHPDLEGALSFLEDFGLVEAERTASRVYMRGFGVQPFVYVAEQSPDGKRHFMGGTWAVREFQDLETAASLPNASPIQTSSAPGGGRFVTVQDPNGFRVSFLHDQILRERDVEAGSQYKEQTAPFFNTAVEKPRRGTFRRFRQGASPVHKLGHYGFIVPKSQYEKTIGWYTTVMNLKPSDVVFDPDTGLDKSCFAHVDLGADFSDHHSFFVAAGPEERPAHAHHSSFEVNDFDTQTLGHGWLRSKGWINCWGIGRHVLGSQIFDYWFDASGNILEHYSDGDLVNEDTPLGRAPAAPDTLHVWGPNIPLAFVTGRVEDAGKAMGAGPDVMDGKAAQFEMRPAIAT